MGGGMDFEEGFTGTRKKGKTAKKLKKLSGRSKKVHLEVVRDSRGKVHMLVPIQPDKRHRIGFDMGWTAQSGVSSGSNWYQEVKVKGRWVVLQTFPTDDIIEIKIPAECELEGEIRLKYPKGNWG